ncbi:MAG: hypothetical protein U9P68_02820 [Pseudomonadota bacterium]|nr:hypothetical protein [Pseudomonadota bacterium]
MSRRPIILAVAGLAWIAGTGAIGAVPSGQADAASHPDPRAAVVLTAQERLHIVDQMTLFLEGSQIIMEAGAQGDLDRLREAAGDMARRQQDPMGPRVRAKLPDSFREMGRLLRQDLSAIAALPDDTPIAEAQAAAAAAMYTCLACHGSYRIETVAE